MSFTAADVHRWLSASSAGVRLQCADGSAWSDSTTLARIALDMASLDSRRVGPGVLFAGVQGEHTHGACFLEAALDGGASAALVEGEAPRLPGRTQPVFVVQDGQSALSRLAASYLGTFTPTVIGITGSNGKTTTKDMVRFALRDHRPTGANPGNLNSRWGLPLAVLGQSGGEEVLVLEMGASQPGEIAELAAITHPRIGCITNIAPAHLAGFGDVEGVVRTKAALVESLPPDGVSILNLDDGHFETLREQSNAERCVTFGRGAGADVRLEESRQGRDGLDVVINGHAQRLPVFGEANGLNAAAACAICAELGLDVADALSGMATVALSPHRSRLLECAGRVILDDCYNANPTSVLAALDSLAALPVTGRRVAVLGSMAELGEASTRMHAEVVNRAKELEVDGLVPVGEAMLESASAVWPSEDLWRGSPGEPVALGRYLAGQSEEDDAFLFKASRSVGLEAALDVMLAELERGAKGGG